MHALDGPLRGSVLPVLPSQLAMSRHEMLFRTGLLLLGIAAVLYATWGLSASLMVQSWTGVNGEQVANVFSYFKPIFLWPTSLAAIVGTTLTGIGIFGRREP